MFITYQQTSEQSYLLNYGDQINIETNKKVISHFKYIQNNKFKYIYNVVPSFNKLLIIYDIDFKKKVEGLINKLRLIDNQNEKKPSQYLIPICYDEEYALDYKKVEKAFSIDFNNFIKLHSSNTFHIFMLGFMPGLPFLGLLDIDKSLPRLESPRISIPKGSVGVVDKLTVIYPNKSSGGWNIVGRTNFKLFNRNTNKQILNPGDIVKFTCISKTEFIKNDK